MLSLNNREGNSARHPQVAPSLLVYFWTVRSTPWYTSAPVSILCRGRAAADTFERMIENVTNFVTIKEMAMAEGKDGQNL